MKTIKIKIRLWIDSDLHVALSTLLRGFILSYIFFVSPTLYTFAWLLYLSLCHLILVEFITIQHKHKAERFIYSIIDIFIQDGPVTEWRNAWRTNNVLRNNGGSIPALYERLFRIFQWFRYQVDSIFKWVPRIHLLG